MATIPSDKGSDIAPTPPPVDSCKKWTRRKELLGWCFGSRISLYSLGFISNFIISLKLLSQCILVALENWCNSHQTTLKSRQIHIIKPTKSLKIHELTPTTVPCNYCANLYTQVPAIKTRIFSFQNIFYYTPHVPPSPPP